MQKTIKLSLILGIITAIAATVLGLAFNITDPIIQEGRIKAEQEAMAELLPEVTDNNFSEKEKIDDGNIVELSIGYDKDEIIGYVFTVNPTGYGGTINMLVAIDTEGNVKGSTVLEHSETAGLGAYVEDESFLNQFDNKEGPFEVVKTDPTEDFQIQAISASTITTNAFVNGVNEAIEYFEEHLKGA